MHLSHPRNIECPPSQKLQKCFSDIVLSPLRANALGLAPALAPEPPSFMVRDVLVRIDLKEISQMEVVTGDVQTERHKKSELLLVVSWWLWS